MISTTLPSKGTRKPDNPAKAEMDNPKNPTDESRSFLKFSNDNLSLSHSDLEQGFNKTRPRIRRDTILSLTAIFLALFCVGLELWNFLGALDNPRCCGNNPREIEILKLELELMKKDVDGIKHRIFEEDLLSDFKAFAEQVKAEELDEDNVDDDTALDGDDSDDYDYDPVYDMDDEDEDEEEAEDSMPSSQEYLNDYHTAPYVADYSGLGDSSSRESRISDLDDVFAALRKTEADSERKLEMSVRENRKSVNREKMHDEGKSSGEIGERDEKKDDIPREVPQDYKASPAVRRKRSDDQERPVGYNPSGIPIYAHSYLRRNRRNFTRKLDSPTLRLYEDLTRDEKTTTEKSNEESTIHHAIITSWDKHPPKKYLAQSRAATSHVSPPASYSSGVRNSQPRHKHAHRSANLQEDGPQALTLNESTVNRKDGEAWKIVKDSPARRSRPHKRRGITRRQQRGSQQVIAAHYGADSLLFTHENDHKGNGNGKHPQGIFKAWKASNWMNDLGMTGHFTLADGELTIQETGLYLIYAQIHYLDMHDENGFRVLVNNDSIMQCMVYSPGQHENKSRSCFSAQAALLQAGDRVVLKDIGEERYTLFQHDKSFFGLVKLGESRYARQSTVN